MRRPCCEKEGINKGAWSKQEDQQLIDYISSHGEGCWRSIPKAAGLRRCGKSCRLRWINYLRPDIKRGNFSHDEEDLIVKLHALLGNRWSLIAGRLPGRTDNEVKNYWNSHVRKKLIRMGIDPNNHKLHQHLPRRPLTSHTSQITESSGSMEDASKPSNCVNNNNSNNNSNNNNNDDDGANSLGEKLAVDSIGDHDNDEASRARLDLNLDLTIAVSRSPAMEKIKVEDSYEAIITAGFGSTEVEQAAPTLNLFR